MFQNISKDFEENQYEDIELNRKEQIKETLKRYFSKKMIILYVLSFMVSLVSFGENKEIAPFGIAIVIAILSNCIPIGIVTILMAIATFISFGSGNALNSILTILLLIVTILIKGPKYEEKSNEKRKLGRRLLICTFLIQIIGMFFKEFYVYDLIVACIYSLCTYIFYKIFVNSITVLMDIGVKKAYSIEEVMGASLLVSIAISAIGNFSIFGYSIRNILCILIVLIMGWKNGILVGATAGVTIGTVLGIIGSGDEMLIATYALSGMIAGIFNKLGKIGVIVGFILGNILLTYVSNGNIQSLIAIQEILIASLGLLAIPKNIKINIEDVYGKMKLLPGTIGGRNLEENKDTIYKLTSMSETISEIARTYKEAAATIVDEEELERQEKDNIKIFKKELENNLEGNEQNILFDDIYSPENDIIEEIFELLLEKEKIDRNDLLDVFANHNNYVVGFDIDYINDDIEKDIEQIVDIINNSYKLSKINFIWKKRLDENKKVVSNQLEEVSKAIETLAGEIDTTNNDIFESKKKEIKILLEEKNIQIKDIVIEEEKNSRKRVTLYTNACEDVEKPTCNVKKMGKIISKVLEENMKLQKQECGIRNNKEDCIYSYVSEDKQVVQVGVANVAKYDSAISGDTCIQKQLEDGKYLIAISDGMGSGKEARKSSKMAIGMLDKLLSSGFDKDTSIRLINSTLNITNKEDMYSTLDVSILDLYSENLEFIKNGSCPTYIKNGRNVEILKSLSLPAGIIEDIDLIVYDRDLQDGDIVVMCSDGILESSDEFTNKELWLKFLLEEIETEDSQKIADIILQEAIDNNYGKPKDDMTVIVAKVKSKF